MHAASFGLNRGFARASNWVSTKKPLRARFKVHLVEPEWRVHSLGAVKVGVCNNTDSLSTGWFYSSDGRSVTLVLANRGHSGLSPWTRVGTEAASRMLTPLTLDAQNTAVVEVELKDGCIYYTFNGVKHRGLDIRHWKGTVCDGGRVWKKVALAVVLPPGATITLLPDDDG